MAELGSDIEKAANFLRLGEVIGIPTETVYGLAGNALDPDAILKIYEVKNRPSFDPLIAHVDSIEKVIDFVDAFSSKAEALAHSFWPGPLTLLFNKKNQIPDLLTSGLPRVAFRVPNHTQTLNLLRLVDFPLAAPSANPFGYVSPVSAGHVNDQLGEKIPYILDGGECAIGIESTIVGFEKDEAIVYRLGGISLEDIQSAVGKVTVKLNQSSNPVAPGMLKSHYSPKRKLVLSDNLAASIDENPEAGIISFMEDYGEKHQFILSKTGDMNEAARNLFKALRHMDEMPISKAFVELVPEKGLGKAINDRLRRATA